MDISNLCRSCMKEVASWEKENFDGRAVEMFCFCTNIKIMEDIKLPKQFCYDCTIKIESCYTFIKEAQNVNITLKNIASRSETSIIIEPDSLKSHTIEPTKLRLTLPDYKLSIGVSNYVEQDIYEDTDYTHTETAILTNDMQIASKETAISCNSNINKSISRNNKIEIDNIIHIDMLKRDSMKVESMNRNDNIKVDESKKENTVKYSLQKRDSTIKFDTSKRDGTIKGDESKRDSTIDDTNKSVCPVCRKGFTSKKWFSKHMEKEHSGHKYTCAHCPKSFSKPFQLAYHATSHSDERKFACNTCGKCFKRRKQLAEHARGHSDVRPYACDKCAMRFKLKSVLKCHMKVHEDVKQYLCSYCGWGFSHAHNLEVHVRTHTGAKPHACAVCGFRAAAASSLRRHARRHSDTRLYVCNHCRKAFTDKSGLARHTRTHTGELPYKCPGCARAFADSWKRKTHLMRAHRLALADIPRMRRDGQTLVDGARP
ncbi:zinc finger protein 84-like isoform X3 [Maniola jurtina]|uniref:zinc finger protein 84-like isoform X3 n=1 Tax=Maniola jurtina TaxID=191418 RepID=UPI001E688306|nr:zinc finger protein 84-like isoform X3 [Maniola jurtina]